MNPNILKAEIIQDICKFLLDPIRSFKFESK